ncbi:MAG TPA: hypothetical protein VFD36_18010 [Kofleriaceae bacterium]|jgi:hypothetical protein|nr:hypothetical protein [Kofleriaceae bacterium]
MTLDPKQARVVDHQTTEFLRQNPSFNRLSAAQQADTIRAMSEIVKTMADAPAGASADPYSPHAMGLANDIETDPNAPGVVKVSGGAQKMIKDMGGAKIGDVIGAGVYQASQMVKQIDFPQFVASLIDGTFKAIVTSSIEQMKAYAEMVKSVSASLNEFKDKNTTDSEARESLVQRYPQLMQIQIVDGAQKVIPRDDAVDDDLPDFGSDLGIGESITSLDEDTIEQKLVPAARNDLARGRQQLLATTILMGINRIIVTDGKINARIRFKFDAVETKKTKATARDLAKMGDTVATQGTTNETTSESGPSSKSWWGKSTGDNYSYDHDLQQETQTVTTPNIQVTSEVETNTDGTIKAGGEMFGEVSINFRSETFPLEKMVNTDQMMQLQNAQQGFRGTPGPGKAAGTAAAPAPAPGTQAGR